MVRENRVQNHVEVDAPQRSIPFILSTARRVARVSSYARKQKPLDLPVSCLADTWARGDSESSSEYRGDTPDRCALPSNADAPYGGRDGGGGGDDAFGTFTPPQNGHRWARGRFGTRWRWRRYLVANQVDVRGVTIPARPDGGKGSGQFCVCARGDHPTWKRATGSPRAPEGTLL